MKALPLHIDVSKSLIDHITDQKSKYTFYIAINFITFNEILFSSNTLQLGADKNLIYMNFIFGLIGLTDSLDNLQQ